MKDHIRQYTLIGIRILPLSVIFSHYAVLPLMSILKSDFCDWDSKSRNITSFFEFLFRGSYGNWSRITMIAASWWILKITCCSKCGATESFSDIHKRLLIFLWLPPNDNAILRHNKPKQLYPTHYFTTLDSSMAQMRCTFLLIHVCL